MSQAKTTKVPMEELWKVRPRIGLDPLDTLRWALEFAQRDLEELTPGDWENLRLELTVFATMQLSKWRGQKPKAMRGPGGYDIFMKVRAPSREPPMIEVATDQEIRDTQADFRRIFSRLYDKGWVSIGPVEIEYLATRRKIRGNLPRELVARMFALVKGIRFGALRYLAEHLMFFGELLEVCHDTTCGRWFVQSRKNQVYCSPQCQTRANTRIYRGNQIFQEVAGRRPTVDEKKQILKFSPQEVREFAEKVLRQQPKPRRKQPRRKGGK